MWEIGRRGLFPFISNKHTMTFIFDTTEYIVSFSGARRINAPSPSHSVVKCFPPFADIRLRFNHQQFMVWD
jgi:hypothetical protein